MSKDEYSHPQQTEAAPRVVVGRWSELGELAARIRTEVFVREQGIAPELERDPGDADCLHCVAFVDGQPAATGRLLPDGHLGRMAVLEPYRGRGYGRLVLQALIDAARARGQHELVLHAQAAAVGFYARQGFEVEGDTFEEAGLLHLRMRKRLAEAEPQAVAAAPAPAAEPLRRPVAGSPAPGPADAAAPAAQGEPALVQVSEWHQTMDDGLGLHQQEWRGYGGQDGAPARGVFLLHGLGEHIGRYDALARWFCARGWRVRGHDHAGHGRSGGRRGALASERQLVEHAQQLIARFADELGEPPLLLGHSMGGALAAQLVVCEGVPVRGLVLSSPALDTGIRPLQRGLADLLYRIAPNLTLGNGLDPQYLSHDPAVVRAYVEDPLVHDRISARLVRWLIGAGRQARAQAGTLRAPTLLLVAGADRLVNPEGSREFARRAPASLLALHDYESLYHELFNEHDPGRRTVLGDLERWLQARPAG